MPITFFRYVTSTCCLFLAGKAEETPKKCRDLVKTVRQLTNDRQFATFGNDPREEIMILERILLQKRDNDLHAFTFLKTKNTKRFWDVFEGCWKPTSMNKSIEMAVDIYIVVDMDVEMILDRLLS